MSKFWHDADAVDDNDEAKAIYSDTSGFLRKEPS